MLRRIQRQPAFLAAQARLVNFLPEGHEETLRKLKAETRGLLADNPVFSGELLDRCSEQYFNLNFEWTYAHTFSPSTVAKHLLGFVTATIESQAGKPFEYFLEKTDEAFWFCENTPEAVQQTQRKMEEFIFHRKFDDPAAARGLSMRSYVSSTGNLVLFAARVDNYLHPEAKADKFESLEKFSTQHFLDVRKNNRMSLDRYADILKELAAAIKPVYSIRQVDESVVSLTIGFLPDRSSYLCVLTTLLQSLQGAQIVKSFMETFSGGQQVYSFFVRGTSKAALEEVANQVLLLPDRPEHPITQLYDAGKLTPREVNYSYTITMFAHYFTPAITSQDYRHLAVALKADSTSLKTLSKLRSTLQGELLSEEYIAKLVPKYVAFVKELYTNFEAGPPKREAIAALYAKVNSLTDNEVERAVLATFVRFNESVVKTNFFKTTRVAAAYRLDPKVFMKDLDLPAMPFGVFLVVGAQFRGFHIRFADIARGGIRVVLSKGNRKYLENRRSVFEENYNLAHTQMLKNKDIAESGSKGVILVSPRRGPNEKVIYMQYIDAVLDVLLPGEAGVRDILPKREILFLGPDENTAGELPSDAAYHARKRGYDAWKSFTTGKGQNIGGIPHELYGMTTESVRANVEAIYKAKGIVDESKLTKFQTGGPDGDLGSNEILRSGEKYLGIVDKSGVLYDPAGLNKEELVRLANNRPLLTVKDFAPSKLSPKGFFVGADETNRTLPDGTVVPSGEKFRDEFHFTDYVTCDTFVPCGGRPSAVTLENVHRLLVDVPDTFTGETMLYGKLGDLASQGKTRYKYIVEGANLFITQDARLALENVGVVLVKDSAANKGGVTSSSFEVLAALCLTDAEHSEHMCVKNGKFPAFYNALVKEIIQRIRHNATREFEAVSAEVAKGALDGKRTTISDELSRRIVAMRTTIINSDLYANEALRALVLKKYVPQIIQQYVPIAQIIERVPENYLRACFSVYIASNYVYSTGLSATEFDFFQFMDTLHEEARKH